ncbi:SWIM zinc finger family protein [Microvirga massiliensis]|uniref:SWIM zinc finger family protein n=1 Tax=Microvirga massiliensis TaxID=1033741 RepID=UPI00062B34F7|nr:SWIM zinc finger family protein [Microvirga massiliensis]
MPIRSLDETSIRALATRESFERGRDYWRRGAVSTLVRRGDELTGEVEGSEIEPYHVTIRLYEGGVTNARCTCLYDWGGYCKHIVAALLKFAKDPDAVMERPSLRELLNSLDHGRLVDLIIRRLNSDPKLGGWIEAELATQPHPGRRTPIDPEPVAAQARTVLAGRYRQRHYWDDYRSSGDIEELHALVDKAVPFLETGDGRNALRILETIADTFVVEWIEFASGSDEHMYELFVDLGRMMAEAVLMSDLKAAERDALVDTVSGWQDQLSDYGAEEGFGLTLRALETGWNEPALQAVLAGEAKTWPPADYDDDWEERELTAVRLRVLDAANRTDAYLNLARAAGAHPSVAIMLAKLDRMSEALAYARETFTLPDESLQLAKVLRDGGRHEEALAIAESGLSLGRSKRGDNNEADDEGFELADTWVGGWRPGRSVVPLAQWLRDYAGPMGRRDLALKAARTAFEHTLSLEDYRAVEVWAGENWKSVRRELLDLLKAARQARDRAEILLDEGLIDDAVRSVGEGESYETSDDVLMRLMDAAHASHPDWVIRVAERKAARIMDAGSAGVYDLAAKWLERAAQAYDAAGRIDEWSARIEGLIEQHRRKYKLRPLLEALRYDR